MQPANGYIHIRTGYQYDDTRHCFDITASYCLNMEDVGQFTKT